MLNSHRHTISIEPLESAGVIFVEENGEGPGVRLKKVVLNFENLVLRIEKFRSDRLGRVLI